MPLIAGASMVTPEGVVDDGWLRVEAGRIAALGSGEPPARPDSSAAWLLPGFVDIHSHGGGGGTVVGADPDQVRTFAETHRRHGTTTLVASLISGPLADLEREVAVLAELSEDGVIAGVHLEGPWISPLRKGAHDERALRVPEPGAVDALLAAGRGQVRMVTLAPELEHGLDAIRAIVDAGSIAAVGHTVAAYEITRQAIEAGATVATHLFNAMAPIHHREPGPVVALMEDERVVVELILDGAHLHRAVAAHVRAAVGADRITLITDAMAAAGNGDGDYVLGNLAVRVDDGVPRLVEGGSVAGSTLTMDRAFRFAVQEAGFTVPEAVLAASTVPARLLGLAGRTGALAVGSAADLVMMDDDFRLEAVMARGAWIA